MIEWSLQAGSGPEMAIAELKDGKLEWQNTTDRFRQWLEVADGTTLRIRALEKEEDNCTLKTRVLFASGDVLRQSFCLSVFESVPDPEIHHHVVSRTGDVCNVTLHCLGSEKVGIDVSWKRGNSSDQLGVLEEGSDADLHVSWRPDSLNSTYTCLLSNPADQKSALLNLASICQSEGTYGSLFLCWFLSWLQVWDFGCGRQGAAQEVFHSAEFQRVEVQKMKSPPEGDGEQNPDCFSTCLPEIPRKMPPVTTLKALDKKDDAFART
uniref:Uncharacterized protein n=1 Tax=Sphaerodactylus townsendi TaxID=933632 RepID=A0ACB8G7R5_9SAUR